MNIDWLMEKARQRGAAYGSETSQWQCQRAQKDRVC